MPLLSSADGTPVYADAFGDPSKPSIVFIHGLSLCATVYDNIFENPEYSKDFYLVRYDMCGHGRSGMSDVIEQYSSKKYAEDFAAILAHFKLHKPLLVGWSMGATIAVDVAAHLPPGTISGVVYLAGLPYIGPIIGTVGRPFILGLLAPLCSTADVPATMKAWIEFGNSLFKEPDQVPTVLQPPQVTSQVLSRPQIPDVIAFFEAGKQGLPLLILNGEHDKQVDGDVVIAHMSKSSEEPFKDGQGKEPYHKPAFTNVTSEYLDAGHALHYDQPEKVMKLIFDFKRKHM